ncbi:MAG: radical SAM protein [Planctomycetales bacterium]|nr:radical SAM protein [Planctomycetales bacterium]
MPTIWDEILHPTPSARGKRMAWRLLRQFASSEQMDREFSGRPKWHWTVSEQPSQAGEHAVKLLMSQPHGVRCETVVLLPNGPAVPSPAPAARAARQRRATVCVSSQPGCGVGCPFCATASLGYRGNLSAQEIVEQVYWGGCRAAQCGRRLRNVVYMGMGEPLHNATAVFESLHWLTSDGGFGLSPRRITVSTVGIPAAMLELARQFPRVRLALSLHAADHELRKQLVPKAVGDLPLLRNTIAAVNSLQVQPVWIEVVLLKQVNDSLQHARQLVEFCRTLNVEINLIPYNSAANAKYFSASERGQREAFAEVLRAAGIRATIRTSLGSASQAACGQLTASGR